ncbi:50S ribosomal subunit L30 [Physcia stellaris]|nr:50S ribosomal subunit L30 [Physcia stellaris]
MEQSKGALPTPSGVTAPRPVTTTLRIASYKTVPNLEVNVPYYQSKPSAIFFPKLISLQVSHLKNFNANVSIALHVAQSQCSQANSLTITTPSTTAIHILNLPPLPPLPPPRLHRNRALPLPRLTTDTNSPSPHYPPITQTQTHTLHTTLLLSRAPLLTRALTPFETSYFLYQRRLNERLSLPFSRYFYYPRGTPGETAYKRSIRERLTPARDIGKYAAYSEEGWDDEVRVGDGVGERERVVEALVREAEGFLRRDSDIGGVEGVEGGGKRRGEEVPKPVGRVSEADRKGDLRSLSRRMERTLYLLVQKEGKDKGKEGEWGFPRSRLGPKESLYTAAERTLVQTGGVNMNTWIVGNWPVGHQILTYPQPLTSTPPSSSPQSSSPTPATPPPSPPQILGEKSFFMKARILAGQANLQNNALGLRDFKWLAKEEVKEVLDPREWNAVRNCLSER